MTSRNKGKTYEREIVNALKDIFPDCTRNWNAQSAIGGVDILNTPGFDFEIKGGKQANIAKVRRWLTQVQTEGKKENFQVVVARPIREENYIIMTYHKLKNNNININFLLFYFF